LTGKYVKYKPEFRDEIAKVIVDSNRSIAEVAREYGLNEATVGSWVKKYRAAHAGEEPPLELSERARLRELEPDRGSQGQYTSTEYRRKLGELGLRHSVGRTGQCWDNALAESFFATLKNERVHLMVYPTRKKAKADIAQWIELFYNHRRIHSALGYRTPHEVRTEYLNSQLAA